MPAIILLSGIATMIGVGGITLVGIEKGSGNEERSNNLFNVTMSLTFLSGIVGSILLYINASLIVEVFSVTGEAANLAIEYAKYTSFFIPFYLMNFVTGFFLKLSGKPMIVAGIMFLGALINIVMDYLLIGPFQLGMGGAAIATGLSQVIPFTICFILLIRTSNFKLAKPIFHLEEIKRIFYNGSSEFLTTITTAFISVAFNFIIMQRVGPTGIAAFTVVMQLMEFARSLGYGVAEGNQNLWSYNFGASNYERVRNLRKLAVGVISVIGLFITVGVFLFGEALSGIFVADSAVNALSVEILGYSALSFIFIGFNIVMPTYYTAIDDPFHSIVLTAYRSLIAPLAGLLILPILFGDRGIWLTFAFIEMTAFILGSILLKRYPLGKRQNLKTL